jgi:hypothetical protein
MQTEQPNVDVNELLEMVRAQVRRCELTEAIVVDDQLIREMTPTRWVEIVGHLRDEDPNAVDRVREVMEQMGTGDIEDILDEDDFPAAVKVVRESKSTKAIALLEPLPYREAALDRLIALLTEVGLKPVCRTRITPDDPSRTGKLYFLDYRMEGVDETAGMHASHLLAELVRRPGESTPPAAVLMSRGQNQKPTQADWEKVASDAGYYRFNFRYMGKEKLDLGKMPFLFFLHELFAALPLGTKYYGQLRGLRNAAASAADAALSQIRQLSPTEFTVFAGKHLGDDTGRKSSRHILELFLGLLDAEVKDNAELEASFRGFAEMLRSSQMLAMTDTDIHTLNQLHNRLLYDRTRWVLSGPVEFGDIYHKLSEQSVYYLVLTPECDLELRNKDNTWAPKADEVLLLRGDVKEKEPDKKQENIVAKPFVSDRSPTWIWWHLRKLFIVPVRDLMTEESGRANLPQPASAGEASQTQVSGERYLKWGRLRQVDAEQIQQEFVSDLASVGTEEVSGKITLLDVEVWQRQPEMRLGDVVIIETSNPKDDKSPYWAFGEGGEELMCPDIAANVILPLALVMELRRPVPKNNFLDKCRSKRLFPADGPPFRLVRSSERVPKDWTPKPPPTDT